LNSLAKKVHDIKFYVEDQEKAVQLFGHHEEHLKALEQKFDVQILARGCDVVITGDGNGNLFIYDENDVPYVNEILGGGDMLANRLRISKKGLDEYTKSLLHFDGANGSTNFEDESGKIWTPHGNVQIKTDQSKFGGASAYFDGSGDYLSTPSHSDFNFGSQNFTIDFWVRLQTSGTTYYILFKEESIQIYLRYYDGEYALYAYFDPSKESQVNLSFKYTDFNSFTINKWYHIAIVRNGSNFMGYVNGEYRGIYSRSGALSSVSKPLYIGARNLSGSIDRYFKGWIDEFRISKGIARWTSSFTPPTIPY